MADASRAVFLSYRREETRHIAGRLADRLTDRLGPEQVFMDVDTVEPGADFAAVIAREVASCNVLIAVIGPTWLTTIDQRRRRRLDDPGDFVVLEIRAALERGIHVIPVLVDGAVMPDRGDLPEGLQGLARRHAVRLDHARFRSDVTFLLNTVDRIVSTPAQKATEPTVDVDVGVAAQAITTPKEPPQRASESDRLGVPIAGQGEAAGAHHPSLSASPPTRPAPAPWSRLRPRLLITAAIVIALAVAGGFVLLAPNNGGPAVITTIPVGDGPVGVAVSGSHAFVINKDSDSMSVIDTGSNKVITVPVGIDPVGVAVSPNGSHAYITIQDSDSVQVTDTGGNKVITVPVGIDPVGVAVSPNGKHAYVTNEGSGSVSVIDTGRNEVTATIPVGAGPVRVAVSSDGSHAFVTNHGSRLMSVIDTGVG